MHAGEAQTLQMGSSLTVRQTLQAETIYVKNIEGHEAPPLVNNGVMFITLEDESEIANLIIWPSLFERQRRAIRSLASPSLFAKIRTRRRSILASVFIRMGREKRPCWNRCGVPGNLCLSGRNRCRTCRLMVHERMPYRSDN